MATRKFKVGNKARPNEYTISSKTLENWPRRAGQYVQVRINDVVQDVRSDGRTRLFYETRLGSFRSEELSIQ